MERTESEFAGAVSGTTEGVRVTVEPAYLPDESDPARSVFAFSYTITLENVGDRDVRLLDRHWIIKSAGEVTGEVVGPGVVGVRPELSPGDTFTYTSGAVIQEPFGSMHGEYTFADGSGRTFSVEIPLFRLDSGFGVH